MDLKQAKLQLEDLKYNQLSFVSDEDKNNKDNEFIKDADAITTILTALENSVSKDEIKDILEKRKSRLVNGKRSYTNKVRINELNLVSKEILNKG